jgi:leucyl aminopeptidase
MLVLGGLDNPNAAIFTKVADLAAQEAIKLPIGQAVIALVGTKVKDKNAEWKASVLMQACSHASYQFRHHKSKPKPLHQLTRIKIHAIDADSTTVRSAVKMGNALDAGMQLAKDLGNEPPNVCHPSYLLAQARMIGRAAKVKVSQLDEKKMAELGMVHSWPSQKAVTSRDA